VTARERLLAALSPEVVAAIEALVDERSVAAEPQHSSSWLTMREAADYLRVSQRTVERRREDGRLRAEYCDGHWLTRPEWLDDYVLSGGRGGDSANRSTLPPRGVHK
jgi:excisionase family DNA binding protein